MMELRKAGSRDNHLLTTDSEGVLFRIWLFRSEGHTEGVIDLQRKVGDIYLDAAEAAITESSSGLLRLMPRGRGKDIPEKWHSIIEINLLAPVSTKAIHPHRGHVFGEGTLSKIVDFRFKFSEFDLREVKVISPIEYGRRGGGLIGEDWPDNYDAPPPIIFLCHSSKDKPFVRRLAKGLRDNYIDVWFDEENILVGQSFIDQIQDGIRRADYIAVVLTPNFLIGPWANREYQMAISREIQANRVKVLPLLRRDCEIPEFLSIKSYADFRGSNFKKGISALVTSICRMSEDKIRSHSKIATGDIAQDLVTSPKSNMKTKNDGEAKMSARTINFRSKVGNAIIGDHTTVNITTRKSVKSKYPEGCIGFDTLRANYIGYLIDRYHEYKEFQEGKTGMNYAVFPSTIKSKFKIGKTRTIYNIPITRFEELASYIQTRIDGTLLAKSNKARGQSKNYEPFDEYVRRNS